MKSFQINDIVHENITKAAVDYGSKIQPFVENALMEWLHNNRSKIQKEKEKREKYLKR